MDPADALEQKRIRSLLRKNYPCIYLKLKSNRVKPRRDLGPLSPDETRIVEELAGWARRGQRAPYWTVIEKLVAESLADEIDTGSSYMRLNKRRRRHDFLCAVTQLTARGMIARHYDTMFLTAPDENTHH